MTEPTPEMVEFAKQAVRVNALNKTGLTTDEDINKLETLGAEAQRTQQAANKRARGGS